MRTTTHRSRSATPTGGIGVLRVVAGPFPLVTSGPDGVGPADGA